MEKRFKGKVIVFTGGSGFLGQQFITALEAEGAEIVNIDARDKSWSTDITDAQAVRTTVTKIYEQFGHIDGLVHAAALNAAPGSSAMHFAPYESFDLDLWRKELEVNITGAQIVTQAIAPIMMEQRSGSIVFIASDLGIIAPNNSIYEKGMFKDVAYVTSKAGMLGMMRAWASYLGPFGVRSNALVPGGMYNGQPESFVQKNSALNMLGRMAKPGDYNEPLAFLLLDGSAYMTGASLIVDGGRTAW